MTVLAPKFAAYLERRAAVSRTAKAARNEAKLQRAMGRIRLGACDLCCKTLWTPAAIIEGDGKNLVVHPACKQARMKLLEAA